MYDQGRNRTYQVVVGGDKDAQDVCPACSGSMLSDCMLLQRFIPSMDVQHSISIVCNIVASVVMLMALKNVLTHRSSIEVIARPCPRWRQQRSNLTPGSAIAKLAESQCAADY